MRLNKKISNILSNAKLLLFLIVIFGLFLRLIFFSGMGISDSLVYSKTANDINAGKVPVHNPTTMIRKQIFDNYGLFDSRIRYCEDVELYYRWYSQGVVFRNLNRYLTKYRVAHGNNTGENINALLYWQLFKLNMMAITKYKIRFSLSGYLFTLKLFLYCLYRSLRLNHIYSVTRDI